MRKYHEQIHPCVRSSICPPTYPQARLHACMRTYIQSYTYTCISICYATIYICVCRYTYWFMHTRLIHRGSFDFVHTSVWAADKLTVWQFQCPAAAATNLKKPTGGFLALHEGTRYCTYCASIDASQYAIRTDCTPFPLD